MFNQIFVSYLTKKNAVTPEQAKEVLEVQKNTRIRIGVLAAEENLMTLQQIEQVNNLQASKNARFGDIAVEMGYMTKDQLESLLTKQPREHIILKQILCDRKYIKSGQFDLALNDFKSSLNIGDKEFENLQDNDIETYISCITGISGDNFILKEYAKLFISMVIRFVDREVFVKKAYKASPDSYKFVVEQDAVGTASGSVKFKLMFSAQDSQAAKTFAENFAKFSMDAFDEDAQDAVKEFLNCVNGLLISELSNTGKMELDLKVPQYYDDLSIDCEIIVLPLSLSIGDFYIFIETK